MSAFPRGADLSANSAQDDPLEAALALAYSPTRERDLCSRTAGLVAALQESLAGSLGKSLSGSMPAATGANCAAKPEETSTDRSRFVLSGEIARGGMGVVLRGRDLDLGREIAVKVLLESHSRNASMVQRFVEEAQISGQLQHPGIVPVYQLGELADGRPFFAMKLVNGRTLAAMLAERSPVKDLPTPNELVERQPAAARLDLPELLAAFEQVCQTLAYAHARGVVHRDLKPANIMIGPFGEVQVMDWGLAKVLAGSPAACEEAKGFSDDLRKLLKNRGSAVSQPGMVMGTPGYMAPEQARGMIQAIDERTDVFGLGAILCEILTEQPPYSGGPSRQLKLLAARADLAPAYERLDASGADAELVELAKSCLSAEPADRPANAGVVARELANYRALTEQRRRDVLMASVEAKAKAAAEGKRRRTTLAMAAAIAAIVLTVGGAWGTMELRRREEAGRTLAQAKEALDRAGHLHEQAKTAPLGELEPWTEARAMANRAETLLERAGDQPALTLRVKWLQSELANEENDRRLAAMLEDIRLRQTDVNAQHGKFAMEQAMPEFAATFRSYGVPLGKDQVQAAAEHLGRRPEAVRDVAIAALDEWTVLSQHFRTGDAAWLGELTAAVDPDPWRNRLRAAWRNDDVQALEKLANEANVHQQPAASLALLGRLLAHNEKHETAAAMLRRARTRFPSDFWLNHDLAYALSHAKRPQLEEAVRYYTAALSLRPQSAGVHVNLGNALLWAQRPLEALGSYESAISLRPDYAMAHFNLATALSQLGRREKAVESYRKAAKLQPTFAMAWQHLGMSLREAGHIAEATKAYEQALVAKPEYAEALCDLGGLRSQAGRHAEALPMFQEAIRLKPDLAQAHSNLGVLKLMQDKPSESLVAFERAADLNPDMPEFHNNVGIALSELKRFEEALFASRRALDLNPEFADAYCTIGHAKLGLNDFAGALDAFEHAHALGQRDPSFGYPTGQWIQDAVNLLRMDRRLTAVLAGDERPQNDEERLELAEFCLRKNLLGASANFYREAMAEPERDASSDAETAKRMTDAAFVAARASAGLGDDAAAIDEDQRAQLREQALTWLRGELERRRSELTAADASRRTAIREELKRWQVEQSLTSLREPEHLVKLPPEQRRAWQRFWMETAGLLADPVEAEGAASVQEAPPGTRPQGLPGNEIREVKPRRMQMLRIGRRGLVEGPKTAYYAWLEQAIALMCPGLLG